MERDIWISGIQLHGKLESGFCVDFFFRHTGLPIDQANDVSRTENVLLTVRLLKTPASESS